MSRMRNIQGVLKEAADLGVFMLVGAGGPLSGSASRADTLPTGFGIAGLGAIYIDTTNGAMYINEGTITNIYWTPANFTQPGLLGTFSDFRDNVGKAISDTAAVYIIPGTGVRVFGSDVTQTDSGFVPAQGLGGPVATLTTTATSGKIAALSCFQTTGSAAPFKPATHGPMCIDCLLTMDSALTSRSMFIGWLGTSADALAVPYTYSGTTITQVQADGGGMTYSSGLTATTEIYAPHNKASEAATIATTATGVDTGVAIATAGTYQRFRVEVSAAGVMTCFIDKIQVTQISASFTTTTGLNPTVLVASLASATKALIIKKFSAWGIRPQAA